MKEFEYPCRLAKVIFFQGTDCLSLSEEHLLMNENFGSAVLNIVSMYKTIEKLQNKEEFAKSLETLPLTTIQGWVWDCESMKYRAILYQGKLTKIALLEIREYTTQNWHSPIVGSTHQIILQKGLVGNEIEKWLGECITVITEYGFTKKNSYEMCKL
jgi:hypothetical protein